MKELSSRQKAIFEAVIGMVPEQPTDCDIRNAVDKASVIYDVVAQIPTGCEVKCPPNAGEPSFRPIIARKLSGSVGALAKTYPHTRIDASKNNWPRSYKDRIVWDVIHNQHEHLDYIYRVVRFVDGNPVEDLKQAGNVESALSFLISTRIHHENFVCKNGTDDGRVSFEVVVETQDAR